MKDPITTVFRVVKSDILEAPLEKFDELYETFDLDYKFEIEKLDSLDEDDFDIEDADIGAMNDLVETGEFEDRDDDFDSIPERVRPPEADINFYIINEEIKYEINLGGLVLYANESPVKDRYKAMETIAIFLIKNQSDFLRSHDLETAYRKIKFLKKIDLLKFHNERFPKNKNKSIGATKSEEKKAPWATKAVANTNIQAPFSSWLIPVSDFFDELWVRIDILKQAIDYHFTQNKSIPLNALDQSRIISCFFDNDYSGQNVRQTLWPKLRGYYDEEYWEQIRLMGGKNSKTQFDDPYLKEIAESVSRLIKKPILRHSVFNE